MSCLNNNGLILRIKTQLVTNRADATEYVWQTEQQDTSAISAPTAQSGLYT